MRARRFAVIGDPIAHSKSPRMHAAAFRALGLAHTYDALRVAPDALDAAVAELRRGAFDGLNVTVPHKERVLALADVLDESARVAGAANTLVRRDDGTIVAHNTDAPALAAEISRLAPADRRWDDATALVLGSGGAARAAVVAAKHHLGVGEVVVRARAFADPARRDAFVASLPCAVRAEAWAPSPPTEARAAALVQATSAGMLGADAGEGAAAIVAWAAVPATAVAIDVVYAPRDTPWLRAARARGLRADDGLGMLARQGALALELWLGIEAPLAAMRSALDGV